MAHELSKHMARESSELLVTTDSLGKRYRQVHALSDCTLTVARGEVFGLLGPNGAGKTTLIRLLLGYLKPTSGRASVDGLDAYAESVAVRRRVAYLPGEARLFRHMRGKETLRFFAEVSDSNWTCHAASRSCRQGCVKNWPWQSYWLLTHRC